MAKYDFNNMMKSSNFKGDAQVAHEEAIFIFDGKPKKELLKLCYNRRRKFYVVPTIICLVLFLAVLAVLANIFDPFIYYLMPVALIILPLGFFEPELDRRYSDKIIITHDSIYQIDYHTYKKDPDGKIIRNYLDNITDIRDEGEFYSFFTGKRQNFFELGEKNKLVKGTPEEFEEFFKKYFNPDEYVEEEIYEDDEVMYEKALAKLEQASKNQIDYEEPDDFDLPYDTDDIDE